jgi:hypothetical protein
MTFPFCVILDANIWIKEHLLQTTISRALLYSISSGGGTIVVPEVVEREVKKILCKNAEKALDDIREKVSLIKHLCGNSDFEKMRLMVPNGDAVQEALHSGMSTRWKQLNGIITRIGFTYDHAARALERILSKYPPCNENNEQFRDCGIWESALDVAKDGPVHLITGDKAFYEQRNTSLGLSSRLQTEVREANLSVNLYSEIPAFLSAMRGTVSELDKEMIAQKIIYAVGPIVNDILEKLNGEFSLGDASTPEVQGFSTPKPNILAISFGIEFQLENATPQRPDAVLTVEGTCSYDTQNKEGVSEIDIRGVLVKLKRWDKEWMVSEEIAQRMFNAFRSIGRPRFTLQYNPS